VKDEEIDWLVYHQVAGHEGIERGALAEACGIPERTIGDSLQRLQQSLLIELRENRIYLLSINESLIRCQIKYDQSLPFTVENGVIRAKKRQE